MDGVFSRSGFPECVANRDAALLEAKLEIWRVYGGVQAHGQLQAVVIYALEDEILPASRGFPRGASTPVSLAANSGWVISFPWYSLGETGRTPVQP